MPDAAPRRRRSGSVTELLEVLAATELFGGAERGARDARSIAATTPVDVPAGSVLFHHGEVGDALYVLVRGRLQVLDRRRRGGGGDRARARWSASWRCSAAGPATPPSGRPATARSCASTSRRSTGSWPGGPPRSWRCPARSWSGSSRRLKERTAPVRTVAVMAAGRGPSADLAAFTARLGAVAAAVRLRDHGRRRARSTRPRETGPATPPPATGATSPWPATSTRSRAATT